MNLDTIPNTVIAGEFKLTVRNSDTGEILDEFIECNQITLDSKQAMIKAISSLSGEGVISKLKVGDDLGNNVTASATTLTFTDNSPMDDTITRSTGDFLTEGFYAGMSLNITNSVSNDGVYTVKSVNSTTITVGSTDSLTSEVLVNVGTLVGIPTGDFPTPAKETDGSGSLQVVDVPTDLTPFVIGYANTESVTFTTSINGASVMSNYPSLTTKTITSAGLFTNDGTVFAYKRYPQKSISALINIDISWTIHF